MCRDYFYLMKWIILNTLTQFLPTALKDFKNYHFDAFDIHFRFLKWRNLLISFNRCNIYQLETMQYGLISWVSNRRCNIFSCGKMQYGVIRWFTNRRWNIYSSGMMQYVLISWFTSGYHLKSEYFLNTWGTSVKYIPIKCQEFMKPYFIKNNGNIWCQRFLNK